MKAAPDISNKIGFSKWSLSRSSLLLRVKVASYPAGPGRKNLVGWNPPKYFSDVAASGLPSATSLTKRINVERQQHRDRALADAGKPFFGDGVEAGERLGWR